MLEIDRVAYEAEAQFIRQALKTWETQWAKDHNGAKPGRDDIKGNDIAKQYTAYNRIRGILAGKPPKEAKPSKPKDIFEEKQEKPREKRKPEPIATPSKRRAVSHETPSKSTQTPISRKLFSPVVPTSIGPTPQRDGRVLGLFDVLEEEWPVATPSRRESAAETPRKQQQKQKQLDILDDSESDEEDGRRMGRTPMSSGRRNLLNHFTAPPPPSFVSGNKSLGTTPLKSRSVNLIDVTPSKPKAPVEFATPAFLRRTTISLDECVDGSNENYMSPPSKLRLPRKPLVRGLSSVLASLRKAEDERLDEELDIMREVEGGGNKSTVENGAGPEADLEQQQLEEMEALDNTEESGQKLLGGFDDEGLYDSEPETAHDRGQPLRVYKKKGQKRTHRLVNMKPTRVKRVEAPIGAEAANETPIGVEGGGDDNDDDKDGDADYTNKTTTKTTTKKTTKETVKKTARKVNELAHANFKRLKLKNTGGKGGPRFNSRFRRRR